MMLSQGGLTIRSILCTVFILFLLVMPLATGSWIVQSISQEVMNKGNSNGLQNGVQIAGASESDIFIVQYVDQAAGVNYPDIRNIAVIHQDDRIVVQTNIPEDINRFVDEIKTRNSDSDIASCRMNFPELDIIPYKPEKPPAEVPKSIDNININEDVIILADGRYDFGDAPDRRYGTLLASGGARHLILPGFYLGEKIDAEDDGQPDKNATGDDTNETDDEDGVIFADSIVPGSVARFDVTASEPGILSAWMDFNGDGDWTDEGEKIVSDRHLDYGVNHITFDVPTRALTGSTYARFRFSSAGGLSFSGPAPDGEVEDYLVQIVESQ
jgi:hypothetical protein